MQYLKDLFEKMYKDKSNIIIDSKLISELTSEDIDNLDGFHMEELLMIEADDDYFCGIRANHFCVECGFDEHFPNKNAALISANHKGLRKITFLIF